MNRAASIMVVHLVRIGAMTILIIAFVFLPFLPGGYDGLAVTLSGVSQLFGVAGPRDEPLVRSHHRGGGGSLPLGVPLALARAPRQFTVRAGHRSTVRKPPTSSSKPCSGSPRRLHWRALAVHRRGLCLWQLKW